MKQWEEALELIIGGNGLLSKRPERYSPNNWPTYYKKAIGQRIQADDGKWFYDFSEFSIGCNPFGYSPNHLRTLPIKYIFSSPLSTLNSKYEYLLAKELNNALDEERAWKFTRGGGESMSLAVRFARALAKKEGPILVTGYHGWHDWYIAANLNKQSLDQLLIPGLEPLGVPEYLKDTIRASSIEDLAKSIDKFQPSIIVFEGSRSELQNQKTIQLLADFQKDKGILIADEITSCFRTDYLTFSKQYSLEPDIIILGKALGSGYAISAVGCSKNLSNFDELKQVFASSTFWTEEIGLKAGYLTTKFFNKKKHFIIKKLRKNTKLIREAMSSHLNNYGFKITLNKHPSLIYSSISYKDANPKLVKSILCAQMALNGFLFSNNIYPSLAHSEKSINLFKKSFTKSLLETKLLLETKDLQYLEKKYNYVRDGFSRLTK